MKLVEILGIFTVVDFYELKEMQSIEHGVKMTHFSSISTEILVQNGWKIVDFHADVFLVASCLLVSIFSGQQRGTNRPADTEKRNKNNKKEK